METEPDQKRTSVATMSWNRKSQAQEVKPKKLRRSRVVKQYLKPKHKQTIVQPETIYVAIFKHVTLYTC